MAKWLAIAGIAVVAMLALLWHQLDASSAEPPRAEAKKPTPAPSVPITQAAPQAAKPSEPAPPEPAPADDAPKKLDPEGDEFFYQFVEVVPKRLTAQAATCYEGISERVHRNQKLSLKFKTKVVNGVVTVHDVTIKENTLNNPALESCFIQQVQRTTWNDASLPDYEADDELVLRPERGMKKFMRDNVEYQGAAAPR
jgi:hypothetical protein